MSHSFEAVLLLLRDLSPEELKNIKDKITQMEDHLEIKSRKPVVIDTRSKLDRELSSPRPNYVELKKRLDEELEEIHAEIVKHRSSGNSSPEETRTTGDKTKKETECVEEDEREILRKLLKKEDSSVEVQEIGTNEKDEREKLRKLLGKDNPAKVQENGTNNKQNERKKNIPKKGKDKPTKSYSYSVYKKANERLFPEEISYFEFMRMKENKRREQEYEKELYQQSLGRRLWY